MKEFNSFHMTSGKVLINKFEVAAIVQDTADKSTYIYVKGADQGFRVKEIYEEVIKKLQLTIE